MLPVIETFDLSTLAFLLAAGSLGRTIVYVLSAGIAFLLVWKLGQRVFERFRIQKKLPPRKVLNEEFLWSLSTVAIWSVMAVPFLWCYSRGYTKIYTDINEYPLWYYWLSFPLSVILHDTYFYWTHRAIHHPSVFKLIHARHHRSRNPSPWAILSFHPLEAMIAFGFVFVTLLVPMHADVFANIFMLVFNVLGHLGHEFYPRGWVRWPVARLLNTSTHHNMHHQRVNGNYSLYFTFWDKIGGTLFRDYEQHYEEVTSRRVAS